ncbi:sensor histidine kinase [Leptobacterium flavescens]|uniref:histidine kinase n=1 Tax=Leptobacterium flavescens TaxID=472055 RepID=A0A6P0UMI6_9FLAO|nr:HAMP domain-containing sensor histidine kinase [Leptobacterium flavescens]NER14571.1 sensor histidine kinase [Leptobacterium flavescens]
MSFSKQKNIIRWILIVASFFIVSLILWNTYSFFQKFKDEERTKMQVWASAQRTLSTASGNTEMQLPLEIIASNTSNPMILVNIEGNIFTSNFGDDENVNDSIFIQRKIRQFSGVNTPIEIMHDGEVLATLYYGNSSLLNKLKYYPLALLLIIILFSGVVYFFYRASTVMEQNKLWAGMAKETAHQIGTPLSSLLGWAEILKTEKVDQAIVEEIEKDIDRLQVIADRFSKIGSATILEKMDVIEQTRDAYDYLKTRSSKLVQFNFTAPEKPIYADLNAQLFSWTIENLVVNGIDAMKGKGTLSVDVSSGGGFAKIRVTDTGKGIPWNNHQIIFEPGFTTKKRGWGLGLSLVKRIVEDYHKGKVKVHSSSRKGTTMQISLKVVT